MDLLNRVTQGDGLEVLQKLSAGTVQLIICEIGSRKISQLKRHWEVYNKILNGIYVVVIIAENKLAEQVIMSNTELFKYRIGWFNNQSIRPDKNELFIFTNRVPAYRPGLGYGTPCYEKFGAAEKQAERVKKALDSPVNLFLHLDDLQKQTIRFNHRCFSDQPFSLLRWLIKNYSKFGDVVCSCSNPLIPYAAMLEGRRFISIVPERKGKFVWDIDLVDFWQEQMNLLQVIFRCLIISVL